MLTARTVSISLATTRSALDHYPPKTRSGAIFSPFKTVDIGCVIDSFIETAVCAETAHEEEEDERGESYLGAMAGGSNRGKTLPKEHSNFTRKLDVSRMPIFNVAKKNARMKSETQAPRSRHADVRKHKRKSEGEVQGGDGGHGNKRARM